MFMMKITPAQLVCLKGVADVEHGTIHNYPWPGTYFRTLDVLIRKNLVAVFDGSHRFITDEGYQVLTEQAGDKDYIDLIQEAS